MFRSKKKKTQGRKRRDVEAGAEAQDVQSSSTPANAVESNPEEAENELHVLENLRKSRSRASKSSLTFSSKASSAKPNGSNGHASVAGYLHTETGLLSFDNGEKETNRRKTKMRPNLVASSAVDVGMDEETKGQYSEENLESLRSEQTVLLPRQGEVVEQEMKAEDVEMEGVMMDVEAGKDAALGSALQEEEFIPLDSSSNARRAKNHVTFGEHPEIHSLSRDAEVVEEDMSGSGDEDEESEQSRRWEEELMRRGGHRIPTPEPSRSRSGGGLPTYPTQKKVPCVTLDSVLMKLEKSVESTSFEDDRASRELARLEAETALIETTLKQQREELLTSSEEFEYFQEVEDFVKGLSFCLREKLPVIESKEKKILDERIQRVETRSQDEERGIAEDIRICLASQRLQEEDVFGLGQLNIRSDGDTAAVVPPRNDAQRASRLQTYEKHFTESYTIDPQLNTRKGEDLFADAIDEISSLDRVYGRFQEWKAKFPEVYKNVYCELAQEKLYAPYVRAELLHWDPLGVVEQGAKQIDTWSLNAFSWYRVISQHLRQSGRGSAIDGPILYQVREVFLEKVGMAISSYFDPYSSLQARSMTLILEEINRHGYTSHVESALQALVTVALDAFSNKAKHTVLIAVDQTTAASCEDVNVIARYVLEKFNALQDNLLTIFVALPKGDIARAGFRCLMQVLYHLLAYIRHCEDTAKKHFVSSATQVVRQLSGSSYLLQLLTEPSQEREFKRVMELFAPYFQVTT